MQAKFHNNGHHCFDVYSILHGEEVHFCAIKNGSDREMQVDNCLVNLDSKCGKIKYWKNRTVCHGQE